MLEESQNTSGATSNMVRNILLGVAAVYVIASLFLMFDLRGRVQTMEEKQKAAEVSAKTLEQKLHSTNASLHDTAEALGSKVGMTQEELDRKTAELRRQQQVAESRLTAEQKKQQQMVSDVTGQVAGVKTELGGAKTDIASTKTDLEATKAKLEKAIGDLGVQSGLIAKNHDELEVLKHRGDRNYFEFTIKKNERKPIATISLQLKKADPKKSKFTLNVLADDKTIEKKDRTANEPLQFYTKPGGNSQLYELVVYTVGKDAVTGYLSTPK